MPLRDHFGPPLDNERSWDELHGGWPMMLVADLSPKLPPGYVAGPRVDTHLPEQDEYEVRVYDLKRHRRLVAAVELVSPGNKDRPESRRAFVAKCAARLRQHVSVAVVDVVTTRRSNLYCELLEFVGQADPALAGDLPALYAAECQWTVPRITQQPRLQTWAYALNVGQPLPTLPLWLSDDLAVPLELESSYEKTCQFLRMP